MDAGAAEHVAGDDASRELARWRARAARAGRWCTAVAAIELAWRAIELIGAAATLASPPEAPAAPSGIDAVDVSAALVAIAGAVGRRSLAWSILAALAYASLAAALLVVGGALRRGEPSAPRAARRWSRSALAVVGAAVVVEVAIVVPTQLDALRAGVAAARAILGELPPDLLAAIDGWGRGAMLGAALAGGLLEATWPVALLVWAGRLEDDQPAGSGKWDSPTRLPSGSRT